MFNLPFLIRTVIIITSLVVGIVLLLLRNKGVGGSSSIYSYAACLVFATCLYVLSEQGILHNPTYLSIIKAISYFFITILPVIVFTFALEYKSHRRWLSVRILALLGLFPLLTQLILHLGSRSIALYAETAVTGTIYISSLSAWGWLSFIYSIGILAAGLVLLFIPFNVINVTPYKIRPMWYFTGSITIAIIVNLIGFSSLIPIPNLDLMLAGFTLIGISFIYYKVKYHPLEISIISRDEILLGLGDGVIVLNGREDIIDMNSTAEQMIGTSISDAYGKPIEQIISNWNNLIHNKDARELEFRGSVYLNSQWRYLSVRLSAIKNSMGGDIGKTLILRDITDRKSVNEDRQRARDEMFAFLRTLFNESGNTQTTGDFLRSALFQIAYTFHVQNGAILILEFSSDIEKPKFNLLAKHGPLTEKEGFLSRLHGSLGAVSWVMKNKQPLIIADAKLEPGLDDISQHYDHLSFGIFPLLANQQVLGLIILARTEAPGFNSDEIIRLNIVTEELASYLYADRQKQMNIIVAERQRLARDLHDSVTQKLYGLVTLTEAIQVGLETGATSKTSEHVSRISVLSRQALREMRLFLHELQPVDLENEGFVSILQQRLVAVEGHSDIQAQFLTGKNISIPKDKEVALYFITQEALNNIIKHAQAKSVHVKLTQRKQSLHLSIVDDGCGFDPGKSGQAGMGLKNMHTRADQIGAILKITSASGKGTKIYLTLPIN
jgi:PAS domain S-box-containing protein